MNGCGAQVVSNACASSRESQRTFILLVAVLLIAPALYFLYATNEPWECGREEFAAWGFHLCSFATRKLTTPRPMQPTTAPMMMKIMVTSTSPLGSSFWRTAGSGGGEVV